MSAEMTPSIVPMNPLPLLTSEDATGTSEPVIPLLAGGVVELGNGDFRLMRPGNSGEWVRLHRGWAPHFPYGSPSGLVPTTYICHLLMTRSTSTVIVTYKSLRHFCRYLTKQGYGTDFVWADVNEALYLQYVTQSQTPVGKNAVQHFRQFYRWAAMNEHDGFYSERADQMYSIRLGGHEKGVAVRTGDSAEGALSNMVFEEILLLLAQAKGPLLPRLCTMLAVELGANVAQFCELRLRDFLTLENSIATRYHLELPRSKKGDGYKQRLQRPISAGLGRLIDDYVHETKGARAALEEDNPHLLLSPRGLPLPQLAFGRALNAFTAASPLAGQVGGHLTARRFRRTFASRLVAAGATIDQLVGLLDHTDAQNAIVYFGLGSDAAERIEEAAGPTYAAVVDRWRGRIVESEEAAMLGDRPEQRVIAPLPLLDTGVGTCARDIRACGLCPFYPPIVATRASGINRGEMRITLVSPRPSRYNGMR